VSLHLRPLEPEDYRVVHALCCHRAVAPFLGTSAHETADAWRRRLAETDPDRVHYLSAWLGPTLAGLVRLEVPSHPRTRHAGDLCIAVHPDLQGRGIGTRLLAAMVDVADRWLGLLRLELNVLADNERAVRLYRRAGFEVEVRRRADMLRDGVAVEGLGMARLRPGFTPGPRPPPPAWPERRAASGPIHLRAIAPADAPALAELHRNESVIWGTLQLPTISVDAWRRRLVAGENTRSLLLLAEVGGRPAAAGGIHGFANPRLRHRVHLGMGVAPEFQGMGVGRRLLDGLLDEARSGFGASRIELEVYPDNERAVRLYERAGFEVEGVRRAAVFRDGTHVDTQVMSLVR
jgi:putative acetyltransferase